MLQKLRSVPRNTVGIFVWQLEILEQSLYANNCHFVFMPVYAFKGRGSSREENCFGGCFMKQKFGKHWHRVM
jgi:hypothetical protein